MAAQVWLRRGRAAATGGFKKCGRYATCIENWLMRRIAPQKRTPGQSNLGETNIRGTGGMRFWQLTCFAAVFAASPLCGAVFAKMPTEQPDLAAEEGFAEDPPIFSMLPVMP